MLAKPRLASQSLAELIAERQATLDESITATQALAQRTVELRKRIEGP